MAETVARVTWCRGRLVHDDQKPILGRRERRGHQQEQQRGWCNSSQRNLLESVVGPVAPEQGCAIRRDKRTGRTLAVEDAEGVAWARCLTPPLLESPWGRAVPFWDPRVRAPENALNSAGAGRRLLDSPPCEARLGVSVEAAHAVRPQLGALLLLGLADTVQLDKQYLLLEFHPMDRRSSGARRADAGSNAGQRCCCANLAHEIKNPLGGIRGAAQLLEQELENAALREYTQVIVQEADGCVR